VVVVRFGTAAVVVVVVVAVASFVGEVDSSSGVRVLLFASRCGAHSSASTHADVTVLSAFLATATPIDSLALLALSASLAAVCRGEHANEGRDAATPRSPRVLGGFSGIDAAAACNCALS
jgi:hypothetical protein